MICSKFYDINYLLVTPETNRIWLKLKQMKENKCTFLDKTKVSTIAIFLKIRPTLESESKLIKKSSTRRRTRTPFKGPLKCIYISCWM